MQDTSFQTLWEYHQKKLKTFVWANVKTKSDTEDILQETYLQGFLHFATLKEKEKFTAWIYTITRNYIYRYYRDKKKFLPVSETVFEKESEYTDILPENKNLQNLAAQCGLKLSEYEFLLQNDIPTIYHTIISIFGSFSKISIDYIEAWIECDVKQTPQKVFAERKGITLSAAKSRVQRAREKIKQLLMDCCLFEFDVRGNVVDYTPICKDKNCPIPAENEFSIFN